MTETTTDLKLAEAMTVAELRAELEASGTAIPEGAKKPDLVDLVNLARDAGAPEGDPPEVVGEVVREEEEEPSDLSPERIAAAESTALALRDEAVVQAPALLPSVAEFTAMREMATAIASTQMVPQAYRGKPDDVLAAILTGRELDMGPMQSLREIFVIDGKPSLSANLLLARLRAGGIQILESESTSDRAWIKARRRDTGEVAEVEWTLEQAKTAGLLGKNNWKHYPEDMLWSRCVGRLCRRLGSDLIGSAMPYSSEEVQDWDDFDKPGGEARRVDPSWNPPADWKELAERLDGHLGAEERVAWVEEAIESAYGVLTVRELDEDKKVEAWVRLKRVLAELDTGGHGDAAFAGRDEVAEIFGRFFDGAALSGPAWALSGDEADSGRPAKGQETLLPSEPADAAGQDAPGGTRESGPGADAEEPSGFVPVDDIPF